jgi:hypothetical protein
VAISTEHINHALARFVIQREQTLAETMASLCSQLSSTLIGMLGETAFISFYESNLYRCQSPLPSIPMNLDGKYDFEFHELKTSLEDLNEADALQFASDLLESFIMLLNSLVGEMVTNKILIQSWGKDFLEILVEEKYKND